MKLVLSWRHYVFFDIHFAMYDFVGMISLEILRSTVIKTVENAV